MSAVQPRTSKNTGIMSVLDWVICMEITGSMSKYTKANLCFHGSWENDNTRFMSWILHCLFPLECRHPADVHAAEWSFFENHNNHCHFHNAHACVTKEQKHIFKCPTVCVCLHFRFTGSDGPSGFGFELTFRLKREAGETAPPTWPAELMQGLARYVFQSGKIQFQNCRCWQWSILRVNATVNVCGVMKV